MPRAQSSKAGGKLKGVVAFFKESSMEIAELAFDLVRDTLKDRRAMAEKIRVGQQKAAKTAPAKKVKKAAAKSAPLATAAPAKRKRGPRRPKAQPESMPEQDLPLDDSLNLADVDTETTGAPDQP